MPLEPTFLVGTVVEPVPVVTTVQAVFCVIWEPLSASSAILYSVSVEISSSSMSLHASASLSSGRNSGQGSIRLFPATLALSSSCGGRITNNPCVSALTPIVVAMELHTSSSVIIASSSSSGGGRLLDLADFRLVVVVGIGLGEAVLLLSIVCVCLKILLSFAVQ